MSRAFLATTQSGQSSFLALNYRTCQRLWQEYGICFFDAQRMNPNLVRSLTESIMGMDQGRELRQIEEKVKANASRRR